MGCKIKTNQHGKLAFRIFWEVLPGGRSWEGTGLNDTPANRALLEAKAMVIAQEIKDRSFDYLRWFPHGNKAAYFESLRQKVKPVTIAEYYESWILNKVPPIVRKSLERSYRQHFKTYLIGKLGAHIIKDVTKDDLEALRLYLSVELTLKLKTIKNVINGTLRAFFRDAIANKLAKDNPCELLDWVTEPKIKPDPLTLYERDKYLAWAKKRLPYKHYVFAVWQFLTGMRPSETTALRLGDVDLARGRASITKSRNLGHEAGPKTQSSKRDIWLMPDLVEMLRTMWPLHGEEDDYLFTNKDGNPVNANSWTEDFWRKGLRACGIRPRKFYSTRHTFVSMALSGHFGIAWMNVKRVEEQTGDSITTLQTNYAKYLEEGSATLSATFSEENRNSLTSQQESWRPRRDLNPPQGSSKRRVKDTVKLGVSSEDHRSSAVGDERIKPTKTWAKRG